MCVSNILSPSTFGSHWRCKYLKMIDKYVVLKTPNKKQLRNVKKGQKIAFFLANEQNWSKKSFCLALFLSVD